MHLIATLMFALSLAAAREAGIWVIEGDARATALLGNLRLDRASHLVACCGDDATNGEVALAVADVVAGRRGPELDCLGADARPDRLFLLGRLHHR